MAIVTEFVAGDDSAFYRVRCRDSDTKEPIDLTGQTVTLRYRIGGASTVEKTMTILTPQTDPANKGKAEYQFQSADLKAGIMVTEATITDASSRELTSINQETTRVKDRLGVTVPL